MNTKVLIKEYLPQPVKIMWLLTTSCPRRECMHNFTEMHSKDLASYFDLASYTDSFQSL